MCAFLHLLAWLNYSVIYPAVIVITSPNQLSKTSVSVRMSSRKGLRPPCSVDSPKCSLVLEAGGGERNLRYSLLQSPFRLCIVSLFDGLKKFF